MASLAIERDGQDGAAASADATYPPAVPLSARAAGEAGRRSRFALPALCAGALGCVAAVGAAGYVLLSGPSFLAGFAFSPGPGAPKREAIRMGRVPDMPEIRNGVPEIVARGPVRVVPVATGGAPAPSPEPDVTRASAPVGREVSLVVEPLSTASLPVASRPTSSPVSAAATDSLRTSAALLSGAPSVPVPAGLVPRAAEMASLPRLASVPLPPPAPRPPLPRAASAPSGKPERLASVANAVPPPQKIARARVDEARPAPPEPEADEDHVRVFGVNVPTIGSTGRKLRDAMGALGDAFVSLPEKF